MANEFVIKISTPADLSGAQAAQVAMAALAQQAKSAGESAERAGADTSQFAAAVGKFQEAVTTFSTLKKGVGEVRGQLSEASHEADHFLQTLKMGVGIDIGHRIVEGLAEIPAKFREAIEEGVRFNAEMETLGISLAGAFRAAEPAKYLNFAAAQQAGTQALDALRSKANELGLDFHALGESLSINLAALTHAGVSDMKQQIDLIVLLQQVVASKGISGSQATRDIIDLLNGQANRTILGKELEPLGVNDATIKAAKEQGQLYEFLTSKFGAYTEAASASANTFSAAQQRLTNETQQLYGEISKPVFEEVRLLYQALAEEIKKPEVRDALRTLGYDVASVVEAGGGLARFAIENAGILVPLATAVGAVTFALTAYKTAQLASIIGTRLTTLVAETAATEAQTVAIAEQTVALEANAAARTATAGAGTGVGAGAGVGGVGSGGLFALVVAGVSGYAAGRGIRTHLANQDAAQEQAQGEASNANSDRLRELLNNVETAGTADDQAKARKALADERDNQQKSLAAAQAQLAEKTAAQTKALPAGIVARNQKDGKLNPDFVDSSLNAKIGDLQQYVTLLERANTEVDKLAGKRPLADEHGKREENALDAYRNSPEYRLAQAQAAGDQNAIDDAQYDEAVAKRRSHLEKEYHLNPEDAEAAAQAEVTAADKRKEDEEDQKQKARDDEKAKREAEQQRKAEEEKTANIKQHDDTLAAEREETAILQARANGENDLADTLEKQRDLRKEITRLQSDGLSYAEAEEEATEHQNAEQAAKDRKFADEKAYETTYQRHPGETAQQYFYRTGRIDAKPTDVDADGGLSSSGLNTSTLAGGTSRDRFAGRQDAAAAALSGSTGAAAALAGASSASDLLARASDYVPTFSSGAVPPRADAFSAATAALPMNLLPTGLDAVRLPTATAGLAPALQNINPPGSGAQAGAGDSAVATAAQGAQQAGQQAAQAAKQNTQAISQTVQAVGGVTSAFQTLKSEQDQQRQEIDQLTAQFQSIVQGL